MSRIAPPIFVINLDRDPDRLAHMQAQFAATGLEFTRVRAVEGASPPESVEFYLDGADGLRPGEIGCYASHLSLYHQIAVGALPSPALILEDDVGVPADLAEFLRALLAALPEDWDLVRLSNPPKRAFLPLKQIDAQRWLCRYSVPPPGLGATLVSRKGARKFMRAAARALPVDQDLRRSWVWGLDTYGVSPAPFAHNVLARSSIEAEPLARAQRRARAARVRALRLAELPARWRLGMREFGLGPWLAAQAVNAALAGVSAAGRSMFLERAAGKLQAWRQGAQAGLDPEVPLAYPPRSRAAPMGAERGRGCSSVG